MQPVRRRGLSDVCVDDSGFDDGNTFLRVQVDDAIETIQADHNPIFDGQGTAGKAGATTPGNEGNPFTGTPTDHRDHFIGCLR